MSYHCQECNKVHNGKELKITKELREVIYKHLIEKPSRNPQEEPTYFLHNESKGQEVVNFIKLCESCYGILKDNEPKIAAEKKIVKVIVSKKDAIQIKEKRNDNQDEKENRRSKKFNKKDTKSSVSYDKSGSFKSFKDLI